MDKPEVSEDLKANFEKIFGNIEEIYKFHSRYAHNCYKTIFVLSADLVAKLMQRKPLQWSAKSILRYLLKVLNISTYDNLNI